CSAALSHRLAGTGPTASRPSRSSSQSSSTESAPGKRPAMPTMAIGSAGDAIVPGDDCDAADCPAVADKVCATAAVGCIALRVGLDACVAGGTGFAVTFAGPAATFLAMCSD